jgi:acetylornithine deacetylase/succinyl-diaminopimelate desuccinylase-like protein
VDIVKRRSVPTTTTTTAAPQRVAPASRPVSSQSVHSIPSRPSSIRVTSSVSQVTNLAPPVVEDEDEQSMDIEEVVHEDPRELMNAIREVETMIEDEYQRYDDHAEYLWPEASPERAERYQRQVQAIRDVFVDEPDMYDTTMVSEYAEEIFQYMGELEVSLLTYCLSPHLLRWCHRLG